MRRLVVSLMSALAVLLLALAAFRQHLSSSPDSGVEQGGGSFSLPNIPNLPVSWWVIVTIIGVVVLLLILVTRHRWISGLGFILLIMLGLLVAVLGPDGALDARKQLKELVLGSNTPQFQLLRPGQAHTYLRDKKCKEGWGLVGQWEGDGVPPPTVKIQVDGYANGMEYNTGPKEWTFANAFSYPGWVRRVEVTNTSGIPVRIVPTCLDG